MRRLFILLRHGLDNTPTKRQLAAIKSMKLKAPFLLSKEMASELIREETELREVRQLLRIMKENERKQLDENRKAQIRHALDERGKRKAIESSVAREAAPGELDEIEQVHFGRSTKRTTGRGR